MYVTNIQSKHTLKQLNQKTVRYSTRRNKVVYRNVTLRNETVALMRR